MGAAALSMSGAHRRRASAPAMGDRNVAGSLSAAAARARVCHCTGVDDIIAGETGDFVLHIPARPNVLPNIDRPPRLWVRALRDTGHGSAPKCEFHAEQTLVRTVSDIRLRYGPLERAGPFLLAVEIDGHHVAGSPFLLCCRPAPAVSEASSFDLPTLVVRAGELAQLTITTRDRFGNRCTSSAAHAVAVHYCRPEEETDRELPRWDGPQARSLVRASARSPAIADRADVYHERLLGAGESLEVVDRADGMYEARVMLRTAGVRRLLGSIGGIPFATAPIELTVCAAALHAPSSVPYGDALATFVVAGVPAQLRLRARDCYGNVCARSGQSWASALEALARDASEWRPIEPSPRVTEGAAAIDTHGGASAAAAASEYEVSVVAPHAGPLRLTLHPIFHGVLDPHPFTIGLLAAPSPFDPSAFTISGDGLRVAVAGEPAQALIRPRSFGDARDLAVRTFGGLRAWLTLPGGAPDGSARALPLRLSRRTASGPAAADGTSAEAAEDKDGGLPRGALGMGAIGTEATPPWEEQLQGKRRLALWHGAQPRDVTLECDEEDLYDVEQWSAHGPRATRVRA